MTIHDRLTSADREYLRAEISRRSRAAIPVRLPAAVPSIRRGDHQDALYLGYRLRIFESKVVVFGPAGTEAVFRGVPAARKFIRNLRKCLVCGKWTKADSRVCSDHPAPALDDADANPHPSPQTEAQTSPFRSRAASASSSASHRVPCASPAHGADDRQEAGATG